MKFICLPLSALLLAGCAGTHPKGTARYDDYDSVKVEQMVGNNVSQAVFAKTIVCLNARRETRRFSALTNTLVTSATNQVVTAVTNQTISVSTNLLFTSMTNLSAALPPAFVQVAGDVAPGAPPDPGASPAGTNAATNLAPQLSTNVSVSVSANASGTLAPNQRAMNHQSVRTFNQQLTTTSNNLSVAVMTNLVITGETNLIVTYVTNTTVVAVTNLIITPTNGLAYDYFLYSELIPPPDFTPLQQGESLVLLVDGARHGFAQSQAGTAFVVRKGFTSALYRVPPEVLLAIANAKEVRIRFKGVNNVVERTMSTGSRQNFREFLARYFVPDAAPGKTHAALEETAHMARR